MTYSIPMDLPALDLDTGLVRVVIDTPQGSRNQAQGREFKISGHGGPQPAQKMLRAAMRQSEKARGG